MDPESTEDVRSDKDDNDETTVMQETVAITSATKDSTFIGPLKKLETFDKKRKHSSSDDDESSTEDIENASASKKTVPDNLNPRWVQAESNKYAPIEMVNGIQISTNLDNMFTIYWNTNIGNVDKLRKSSHKD